MVKLMIVSFALFLLGATAVAGAQSHASTSRSVPSLVSQASTTEGDVPAAEAPVALATPAQCYLQLELCLDHCDGDIYCNRQCATQYQKCMGH